MPITGERATGEVDSHDNQDGYAVDNNDCSIDAADMSIIDNNSPKTRPLAEPHCTSAVPSPQASSNGVSHSKPKDMLEENALAGEKLIRYEVKNDYTNGNVLEDSQIYVSMYRIVITMKNNQGLANIPLCSLENVESKEDSLLQLNIKDGKIIRLKAANREAALELYKKLTSICTSKRALKDVFANIFRENVRKDGVKLKWIHSSADEVYDINSSLHPLQKEFAHLRLDPAKWRISDANKNFKICESYPEYLIVPTSVSDEQLAELPSGRFMSRFPACVWRHTKSGGLLYRSAQPKITWLGTVNQADINYVEKLAKMNNDEPLVNGASANGSANGACAGQTRNQKMLILDMRSYTAAWANRAKGGGFESSDTYLNTEVEFMSLGNIHNMRYSFSQLRNVVNTPDDPNCLVSLHSTQWHQFVSAILRAAVRCQEAVMSGRTVLVHCSDGWDRTTQIVSLCKLLGDPYYRTFEGFKYLVQREWVEFGHKFQDRNGVLNDDPNEFAPIFLQWLDCVHQLMYQNRTSFEFNRRYLMKLAQHSYSGLFGTFLFNNMKEAKRCSVMYDTDNSSTESDFSAINSMPSMFSVWDYLGRHNPEFHNVLYKVAHSASTLKCSYDLLDIQIWREVYKTSEIESATSPLIVDVASPNTSLTRSHSTTSLNDPHNPHSLHNSHASHTSLTRKCETAAKKVDLMSFMDQDGLTRVPLDEDVYQLFRPETQRDSDVSSVDVEPVTHSTPVKPNARSSAPDNVAYPKNCNGRSPDAGGSPHSNGEIIVK
uniref:Phosphatidylinositol-3-phosphatase n=1 Tax=Panagrellus redivivus TaxID=6233 RepID=A0A7E4VM41_PANRE